MKTCTQCKQTKPTDGFYPRGDRGGYRSRCKDCEAKKRAAEAPRRRVYRQAIKAQTAATHAEYYRTHRDEILTYNREYYQKRRQEEPEWELLSRAKNRASREGLSFDLTVKDIHIPDICPVLGLSLEMTSRRGKQGPLPNSLSIDRIDSSKGYTRGNVRVISNRANTLKSNATVEELELVLKDLRSRGEGTIPSALGDY